MHIQPYWETYTVDTENTVVQGDANEIDIWYSRNGNKTFPRGFIRDLSRHQINARSALYLQRVSIMRSKRPALLGIARAATNTRQIPDTSLPSFPTRIFSPEDFALAWIKNRSNEVPKGPSSGSLRVPASWQAASNLFSSPTPYEASDRIRANLTDGNPQVRTAIRKKSLHAARKMARAEEYGK